MEPLTDADARILIADPAPAARQVLGDLFSPFYHLSLAGDAGEASARLVHHRIDLALVDPALAGAASLLRELRSADPNLPVVLLAPSRTEAPERRGAPYRVLPRDLLRSERGRAQLLLSVERAIRAGQRARETSFHRRRHHDGSFLVGDSDAMGRVREQVAAAAGSDLNLLITGETGVGKTLVAEAVHYASERRGGRPFVTVAPSAVAPSLFESELFGHVRGAFTGATTTQTGAFEAAQKGTLFLDEIGDLDLDLQRKLLRAVEARIIRRVGDIREIELEVRIVAATNRDVEGDVRSGRFRAALFQRLNEQRLHLPPLRERSEDVVPLLQHFTRQLHPERELRVRPDGRRVLEAHAWPGNIRELRSLARRLCAAGAPPEVGEAELVALLPGRIDRGAESDVPPEQGIRVFSRRVYLEALREHDFSIRGTARALGIPYHTLRSRLASLELLGVVQERKGRAAPAAAEPVPEPQA